MIGLSYRFFQVKFKSQIPPQAGLYTPEEGKTKTLHFWRRILYEVSALNSWFNASMAFKTLGPAITQVIDVAEEETASTLIWFKERIENNLEAIPGVAAKLG